MTTIYVQRPEVDPDENSQQLVWLDVEPEAFEESDVVVYPAEIGAITDVSSAQRIIPSLKYCDGMIVTKVVFVD